MWLLTYNGTMLGLFEKSRLCGRGMTSGQFTGRVATLALDGTSETL